MCVVCGFYKIRLWCVKATRERKVFFYLEFLDFRLLFIIVWCLKSERLKMFYVYDQKSLQGNMLIAYSP